MYKVLGMVTLGIILFSIVPIVNAEDSSTPQSLIMTEVELNAVGQDKDVVKKSCNVNLDFPTSERWVEVHNPTNQVIDPEGIAIGLAEANGTKWLTFVYPGSFSPMKPSEYRVIELLSDYYPNVNATLVLARFDGNITILDSTPSLSDTFADARTWQRIDGEWTFNESTPCAPVPEFSSMLFLILPAFVASAIILGKIHRSGNGLSK